MTRAGYQLDYTEQDRKRHYEASVQQDRCIVCLMGMANSHGLARDALTVEQLGRDWYHAPRSSEQDGLDR